MAKAFSNDEIVQRIALCMMIVERTKNPKVIETQEREVMLYFEVLAYRTGKTRILRRRDVSSHDVA